ncbi:MAG: tRNA (adenosine(37)-N6)-dimethylallyltransferase MiaA [Bacteroidales bacterium]
MHTERTPLITVLGHTAAGKTGFAARLAHRLNGEILSADSRQVYRGMNIGTGKDLQDYVVDGNPVPHHLIDVVDAGTEYNVYRFKNDFLRAYTDIRQRGKVPVLCGGSGLYLEAILRDYSMLHVPVDEALRADLESRSYEELKSLLALYGPLHNTTDTVNRKRLVRAIEIAMHQGSQETEDRKPAELDSLVLGIRFERMNRRDRITRRLEQRLKEGLVEEVEALHRQGISHEKLEYYGLEYRFVSRYLARILTYEEMVSGLNTAIHQFAKRQMTYFRGMERRGIDIVWLRGENPPEDTLERAVDLSRVLLARSGSVI